MAQRFARPKHNWSAMSARSRARATKLAGQYDISRRSAREMYNRGTFKPFARNPEDRVPEKVRKLNVLRDAVREHFENIFHNEFSWETGGRARFNERITHVKSVRTLRYMSVADDDEIRAIAAAQPADEDKRRPRGLPIWAEWIEHGGWFLDHVWQNPFWYH